MLRGLSFSLEGPRVLGVLGPNGAGKTTLFDLLAGLSTPDQGEISLFGNSLRGKPYPREKVGVVLQREYVLEGISAYEYAELFAAIYRVPKAASEVIARAGLQQRAALPLASLSGGEAQRLFIATALLHKPSLLLLDEPTSALDPAAKREVREWLRDVAPGTACLLSTHDLREAELLCDEVLFLVQGEAKAHGSRAQLVEQASQHGAEPTLEGAFFYFCQAQLDGRGGVLPFGASS